MQKNSSARQVEVSGKISNQLTFGFMEPVDRQLKLSAYFSKQDKAEGYQKA
jgi:hypothetical protein